MKRIAPNNSSAFTLIEICAVIAVIGLLSAAAVLSLAHTAARHRLDAVRREFEQCDTLVRSAARQGGHAQELVFDLEHGRVMWPTTDSAKPMQLVRLDARDHVVFRNAEQFLDDRQFTVDFSSLGFSQTYALGLSRDDEAAQGGQALRDDETRHWMIVAGMTGRIFWTDDEKQLDGIFQSLAGHSLASAGPDPD